MFELKYTL